MTASAKECEGRVALVTGASRGIGAAIAERLAAAGASVAAVARSLGTSRTGQPGTLEETVARIRERGGTAVAIEGDVLDADSLAAAVGRCREVLGPVDILVNNAAQGPYRAFDAFTAKDFRVTFEANVLAPLQLSQLVLPEMKRKGRGWILNISSATAIHPQGPPFIAWERTGGHHLYASSKAALNRLTAGLAAEVGEDGISVNTLAPLAAVITPAVQSLGIDKWLEPSMIEPVETMAEAALALCCCGPEVTGRVTSSLPLLEELHREPRTLDGAAPYRPEARAGA